MIRDFKLQNFYVNEKSIKVIDPKGKLKDHRPKPRELKPMQFVSNSLATNVELYELPLKAVQRDDITVSIWPEGGTVVGLKKPILRKRQELMSQFWKSMSLEFRITIGTDWENFVAKSVETDLLKNLCTDVKFDRNTQVNSFENILM